MTYLITVNGEFSGLYDTPDLVRTNLLIILITNLEKGKIKVGKYENIQDFLLVPKFDEQNLEIPELKKELRSLNIHIYRQEREENGKYALQKIMNHVSWRFMELEERLKHDHRIKVTFPGDNSQDHQLGTPYIDHWKLIDSKNWKKLSETLHHYIAKKIRELEKKFSCSDDEKRIRFGEVLYDNASKMSIQVWSANKLNWNLPEGSEIPGEYQAQQMKFQEPGVFGIVVTPRYGYHDLTPEEYEN